MDNTQQIKINWYPGHMAKAKRTMQEDIKLTDLIIEIRDARVPLSSANPDIDRLAGNKFRLILLNKADLADEQITKDWITYFENRGIAAAALDSRVNGRMRSVLNLIQTVCREKLERDRKRGILNRPVRAMVAGIPNVGKSTFINSFAGKTAAKTGNKPGVTKSDQWIRLNRQVELLDTPGLLWPKFEDPETGLHLAFIGSINDEILDKQYLAYSLLSFLKKNCPEKLTERYSVEWSEDINEVIERIAVSRKALKKGGEPDSEKAAAMILDDFRSAKIGRISLERPE